MKKKLFAFEFLFVPDQHGTRQVVDCDAVRFEIDSNGVQPVLLDENLSRLSYQDRDYETLRTASD